MRTTKRLRLVSIGLMLALLGTLVVFQGAGGHANRDARAILRNTDGDVVGVAGFTQHRGKVLVSVEIDELAVGQGAFHGFHVHAVGQCDPATGFTSAGGHFNPTEAHHGDHAGDLPVLYLNEDGTAQAAFVTDRFRIRHLFDQDGSALIIHELPNNYANIPDRYQSTDAAEPGPDEATLGTGDAGARIACGVIEKDD